MFFLSNFSVIIVDITILSIFLILLLIGFHRTKKRRARLLGDTFNEKYESEQSFHSRTTESPLFVIPPWRNKSHLLLILASSGFFFGLFLVSIYEVIFIVYPNFTSVISFLFVGVVSLGMFVVIPLFGIVLDQKYEFYSDSFAIISRSKVRGAFSYSQVKNVQNARYWSPW